MDAVFRIIGIIVCGLGGGLLCVAIVWFSVGWRAARGQRLATSSERSARRKA